MRLEIVGRHARHVDEVAVLARLMAVREPDVPAVVVDRERHARRERRRLDAGNRARPASSACVEKLRLRSLGVAQHVGVRRNEREPSAGKPTFVRCEATRLRVSSAATTSSTPVTAIWPATSTSRSVQRRPPRAARHIASPRRSATRFGRDACDRRRQPASSAGDEASTTNVNSEDARVDAQIERERNRQRQAAATRRRDVSPPGEQRPPIAPRSEITSALGHELADQPRRGSRRSRAGCRSPAAVPTRARAACSRRWRTRSAAPDRRPTSGRRRSAR